MNTYKTNLNLIQKVLQYNNLENFLDGLEFMGLTTIIKSGGPFTVFAPVNEAFLDIPENVVKLVEEENDFIGSILQNHIAPGNYNASDLSKIHNLITLIGEDLKITNQNGSLWINDAKILRSDLLASNGVIHMVDQLLLPKRFLASTAQSQLIHS